MRNIILLAALLASSGAGAADSVSTSCTHSRFYGSMQCRTVFSEVASPRALTAAEIEEARIADLKWETFCMPERYVDSLGMTRMRFAHSGCEYGRSE